MKLFKDFSLSDIDIYIRRLAYWKIVVVAVILAGIYYYGYSTMLGIKQRIELVNSACQNYRVKAKKKYKLIQKLSRYKSNTIFLMSRLQTLDTIKNILTKRNFKYVLDIEQQARVGRNGMVNVNNITATTAKMGIYKYIPLKIVVNDYVDFANLLGTIKLLQKANFILTGVDSVTANGVNRIILTGKLYVK